MKTAIITLFAATTICLSLGCENRDELDEAQAIALTNGDPHKGKMLVSAYGCTACHTIPGIRNAEGLAAPPLTKVASRMYIGGVMKNTPTNMMQWIKDPPSVDPLTAMPNVHVSEH